MIDDVKQLISTLPDTEFTGELNRSVGQGAKFSLLLSMLHSDILNRPKLQGNAPASEPFQERVDSLSHYPKEPLSASPQELLKMQVTKSLTQDSVQDAMLWQIMHPAPLSLFNDAKRLADDVVMNCDFHTQTRLKQPDVAALEVDETGLYDILTELEPLSGTSENTSL